LASFYFPRNDLKIYWVKIILFFVTSIIIVVYWIFMFGEIITTLTNCAK
jgi:hypothetical protein